MNNKGSTAIITSLVTITAVAFVSISLDLSRYMLAANAVEQAAIDASRCVSATDGECITVSAPVISTNWIGVQPGVSTPVLSTYNYSLTEQEGDLSYTYFTAMSGTPTASMSVTSIPLATFTTDAGFSQIDRSTRLEWTVNEAVPQFLYPAWNETFERNNENGSIGSYMSSYSVPQAMMGQLDFGTHSIAPSSTLSLISSVSVPALPINTVCSSGFSCGAVSSTGTGSDFTNFARVSIKPFGYFDPASRNVNLQWGEGGAEAPGLAIEIFDASGTSLGVRDLGGRASVLVPAAGGSMNMWMRGPNGSHGGDNSVSYHDILVPRGGSFNLAVNIRNHDSIDTVSADIDVFYFFDNYSLTSYQQVQDCGTTRLTLTDDISAVSCPSACHTDAGSPQGASCSLVNEVRTPICADNGIDTFPNTSAPSSTASVYTCSTTSPGLPIPADAECSVWRYVPDASAKNVEVAVNASVLGCTASHTAEIDCLTNGEKAYARSLSGSIGTSFAPRAAIACSDALANFRQEARNVNNTNNSAGNSARIPETSTNSIRWNTSSVSPENWMNRPTLQDVPASVFTTIRVIMDNHAQLAGSAGSGCYLPGGLSYEDSGCPTDYNFVPVSSTQVTVGALPQFGFTYDSAAPGPECSNTPTIGKECQYGSLSELIKAEFRGMYPELLDPGFSPDISEVLVQTETLTMEGLNSLLAGLPSDAMRSCVAYSGVCERGSIVDLGNFDPELYPNGPIECQNGTYLACYPDNTNVLNPVVSNESESSVHAVFDSKMLNLLPDASKNCEDAGCYNFDVNTSGPDVLITASYKAPVGSILGAIIGSDYLEITHSQSEQNELKAVTK